MSIQKPTPEEITAILEAHARWRQGEEGGTRAYLSEANLARANLARADLADADLSGAYLRGADLSGANLRGAYLSWADLRGADLSGADLSGAYLRGADLSGANLRGAYLSGADLSEANLRGAYLPSPTIVLLARWGSLPDDLTVVLMRLDASGHPGGGEPFRRWALENGPCPYTGCPVQRVANFQQRKECWGLEVKPMGLWEIMDRILRLKCRGWDK